MLVPCDLLAMELTRQLSKRVSILKKNNIFPKLVTVLLGNSAEQLSFVSIKRRIATKIGIDFEFKHIKNEIKFSSFLTDLSNSAQDPKTSGIIVQHPLPTDFNQQEMYALIPESKEIEGHKKNSTYQFPLSLAVLSALKYIFNKDKDPANSIVEYQKDKSFFASILQGKKIVIVGKGSTGGAPIARTFSDLGANFNVVDSKTLNPENLFKKADIIVTAVGESIIKPNQIGSGVILLNVGLRKENGKLYGDYDESKISDIASWYTKTPGGLGPLDVLYLYKNLLDLVELQNNIQVING